MSEFLSESLYNASHEASTGLPSRSAWGSRQRARSLLAKDVPRRTACRGKAKMGMFLEFFAKANRLPGGKAVKAEAERSLKCAI
jgi:hypothetical protein